MVNITPVARALAFAKAAKAVKKPIGTPVKKPPAKPKGVDYRISPIEKPGKKGTIGIPNPDAINKYLTNDTTYQQQTAAINKALGDYTANNRQSQNQYNSQYGQNLYDLNTERDQSGIDQQGDFAGRGMLRSGGYAVADSSRRNQYASRQSTMDLNKGAYMQNLTSDLTNFNSSQALAQQQAKQDAINRRALSLLNGGS